MENKDKETIEAEVVGEEKVEKKDNVFKKFWNKTKESVNGALLESKIEMKYKEENLCFTLYEKNQMLSSGLNGNYVDGGIVVFGEKEIDKYSVIVEDEKETAYYTLDTKETEIKVVVDGVEYRRKGTFIGIDKNVEEVNVIKAGKKYYLYKGN